MLVCSRRLVYGRLKKGDILDAQSSESPSVREDSAEVVLAAITDRILDYVDTIDYMEISAGGPGQYAVRVSATPHQDRLGFVLTL